MQSNYLRVLYTEGMIPYTVTVVALNGAPQPGEPRTETFFTEEGGLCLVLQWFKFYTHSVDCWPQPQSSTSCSSGAHTNSVWWTHHGRHTVETGVTVLLGRPINSCISVERSTESGAPQPSIEESYYCLELSWPDSREVTLDSNCSLHISSYNEELCTVAQENKPPSSVKNVSVLGSPGWGAPFSATTVTVYGIIPSVYP